MRILVTPDYAALSLTAAEIVLQAVQSRQELTLGLPTGNTPLGMYRELTRAYREGRANFSEVRTFNLDEYLGLSPGDPHRFDAYMREHFFNHVNVPPLNIHFPDDTNDYERQISDAGGIDLLVVGIGANGHIAFNEPGSSFASRTRRVELAPKTIENARKHFDPIPVPTSAVTMGIATILECRRIVLLASGRPKADIVHHALQGPSSPSVPASALQQHPDVTVIVDTDAARNL
jgi:glucosamine-6-phosphate deaminase